MIVFTQDKQRIFWHCRKDPILFAYLLGDLDDRLFPQCQWICVYGERREMQELLLVYHGSTPPTLMALKTGASLGHAAEEILEILPDNFALQTNSPELMTALAGSYTLRPPRALLKMGLTSFRPPPVNDYLEAVEPLTASDADELAAFYQLAYPDGYYNADHLHLGHWCCYRENERVVGAVGVHVCSDHYQVAVIGGCAVDPGFRGNGIATALVAHLITELVEPEKRISLNVEASNAPAIRCYEKLGFQTTHRLIESVATRMRS